MAKSKAKKMREHKVRQGKSNPADFRGSWNGIHPTTKTTPTIIEKIRKSESKHKPKLLYSN